jgi:hypothetical protein
VGVLGIQDNQAATIVMAAAAVLGEEVEAITAIVILGQWAQIADGKMAEEATMIMGEAVEEDIMIEVVEADIKVVVDSRMGTKIEVVEDTVIAVAQRKTPKAFMAMSVRAP